MPRLLMHRCAKLWQADNGHRPGANSSSAHELGSIQAGWLASAMIISDHLDAFTYGQLDALHFDPGSIPKQTEHSIAALISEGLEC